MTDLSFRSIADPWLVVVVGEPSTLAILRSEPAGPIDLLGEAFLSDKSEVLGFVDRVVDATDALVGLDVSFSPLPSDREVKLLASPLLQKIDAQSYRVHLARGVLPYRLRTDQAFPADVLVAASGRVGLLLPLYALTPRDLAALERGFRWKAVVGGSNAQPVAAAVSEPDIHR